MSEPVCKSSASIDPAWVAKWEDERGPMTGSYVRMPSGGWDKGLVKILAFKPGFGPLGPVAKAETRRLAVGWRLPTENALTSCLPCVLRDDFEPKVIVACKIIGLGSWDHYCAPCADKVGAFEPAKCEPWCGKRYPDSNVPVCATLGVPPGEETEPPFTMKNYGDDNRAFCKTQCREAACLAKAKAGAVSNATARKSCAGCNNTGWRYNSSNPVPCGCECTNLVSVQQAANTNQGQINQVAMAVPRRSGADCPPPVTVTAIDEVASFGEQEMDTLDKLMACRTPGCWAGSMLPKLFCDPCVEENICRDSNYGARCSTACYVANRHMPAVAKVKPAKWKAPVEGIGGKDLSVAWAVAQSRVGALPNLPPRPRQSRDATIRKVEGDLPWMRPRWR